MMRLLSVFLMLLLAASALAGCVGDAPAAEDTGDDGNDDDDNNNTLDDQDPGDDNETAETSGVSPEDAQAYLATAMDAAQNPTDTSRVRVVGEFATTADATPGLVMELALDEDAGTMKVEFRADPEHMSPQAQQQMGGMGGTFGAYAYENVVAFVLQDMVILNYTTDGSNPVATLEENAEQGATEVPTSVEDVFAMIQADENVTVTSTEMTEYEGREALEIAFEYTSEDGSVQTGSAKVHLEPEPVLAYFEATQNPDAPNAQGMGFARLTFDYGDDVTIEFSEEMQRTMGLVTEKEAADNVTATFTFRTPDGWAQVAPEDLTLSVLRAGAFAQATMFGGEPSALLEMNLADASAGNDNVTATFTDVDGDGFVSAGDTLVVESHDPENLTAADLAVSFVDAETGLTVVPGPAFALAGLATVGAALLTRRRRG